MAQVKIGKTGYMVWLLATVCMAALGVTLTPEQALAWGAGMHVAQGSFILENLAMIRPEIAAILSTYPHDYIYGCISADIFIGKGYKRRDDHCHNWSVGERVLADAGNDSTRAYAYGYLTHLAADVIAHNHLIPNLLYSTPTSRTIGHVFWEFRADRFISKRHWMMASKVVSMHNHGNDTLIKNVMNRSHLRFGAKKLVFKRAVRLTDIITWREQVQETIFEGFRVLTRKRVNTLNNHSINLILDLFIRGREAVCMKYDPVGTDNTIHAKLIRRADQLAWRIDDATDLFPVPQEIQSLDYVDHETERL
ncbi:MAG: zinc dependent phospholipase C family protein [Nitrospinae bacterium]|nr:zinc dependent phospholipase C family protein [Nitrospinota bacterium]